MKRKLLSVLLVLMLASTGMLSSCGTSTPEGTESKETSSAAAETTAPNRDIIPGGVPSSEESPVVFTLHGAEGPRGGTVEVVISISASTDVNSAALYELTYDKDILTFKEFADYQNFLDNYCVLPGGIDDEKEVIVLAMKDTSSLNAVIGSIVFEISKDAPVGTTAVEMTSLVKFDSDLVDSCVSNAEITVTKN